MPEEVTTLALDPMKGMITSYLASPQGKETVKNYLSSPEGTKAICEYMATPAGKETVRHLLPCILDALPLTPETRNLIAKSIQDQD
jgi:hypothetical protein